VPQEFALDYIDVATRIAEFRAKYPGGSLRPADLAVPYRIERIDNQSYIVVVAAAYRDADDPLPGVGMAYEVVPGRTPYTVRSELQNAETSAWGRAIVAALAADTKKGVASGEEVRNRTAERDEPAREQRGRAQRSSHDPGEVRAQIGRWCKAHGIDPQEAAERFSAAHGRHIGEETEPKVLLKFLAEWQKGHQTVVPASTPAGADEPGARYGEGDGA
jgi:hypothetical protein